jgi:hypothetical protein
MMLRGSLFAGFFAWVLPIGASGGACNEWFSNGVDEQHYICHDTVGQAHHLLAHLIIRILIRYVSSLPFSLFQGHLIASQRTKNIRTRLRAFVVSQYNVCQQSTWVVSCLKWAIQWRDLAAAGAVRLSDKG